MIYSKKEYYVADNQVVSDDDIKDAIKIANETNEIIELTWSGPGHIWYPSELNAYHLIVKPGSSFKEIKEKTPKIYGI